MLYGCLLTACSILGMVQAIETSLKYLDGRIDLMLMHAPGDPSLRAETWRALEEAKAQVRASCSYHQYCLLCGIMPGGPLSLKGFQVMKPSSVVPDQLDTFKWERREAESMLSASRAE